MEKLYKKVIEEFGQDAQIIQTVEELNELASALLQFRRKRETAADDLRNVLEEIADVEIMIDQLRLIFEECKFEIDIWKDYKLKKLKQRIKENDINTNRCR
jgi:NTP pyrophosphatase (non-canonical NTP hydrolase)